MNFGERLLRIRKKRKISQEELAEKLDVSRQTVYRWEYGEAKPDIEQLYTLCKLFKVFPEYFIDPEIEPDEGESSRFVNSRYCVPVDYVPKSMIVFSLILWIIVATVSVVGFFIGCVILIVEGYFEQIYSFIVLGIFLIGIFVISIIGMRKSVVNLKKYSKKMK